MVDSDRTLRILFISILIEVIGFGILLPIVPLLLTEPSSSFFILPDHLSIQIGYILLGILVAAYPLGQFFATPILGQLSDRYGRKRLLILSILGTVIANIIFGIGILLASIPLLLLSRLVNGLTGGNVAIAQATIADISDQDTKAKNFGILGAAFGTGFIIGPFLGGLLSSPQIHPFFTPSTPFWVAAFISSTSILLVHFLMPETSPMEGTAGINLLQPIHNIIDAVTIRGMRKLFITNFFYFSGFTFFTSFISVFLVKRFGMTQFDIGNFFLYIGILVIIGQTVVVPRVFSRFTEKQILPFTLILTGLFILLQYFPDNLWLFLAIGPFFAFANALTQVAINTLVSNQAKKEEQGLALGINSSLRALGTAVPASISGVAAALFEPGTPLLIAASIIMATGAVYIATERLRTAT